MPNVCSAYSHISPPRPYHRRQRHRMAVSAPGEAPGSVLALRTLDQRTNATDLTISSFSLGRTDTRAVVQGEALPKQPIDPEAAAWLLLAC